MIGTLLRIGWLELKRDRAALLLSFFVPIMFFSVFAVVFGSQSNRAGTSKVRLAVVDEDGSEMSKRLVEGLRAEKGLSVRLTKSAPGTAEAASEPPLDRGAAESLVREGTVPVALILPKGMAGGLFGFGGGSGGEKAILLADTSDPIAPQLVNGLLQKTAMTSAPDLLATDGLSQFEQYAGAFTPEQRKAVDAWIPSLREPSRSPVAATGKGDDSGMQGIVPVTMKDVLGETKRNPTISFYAAGVAVMFLLFTASATGGVLLDEVENGTLDRVLSSRVGMGRLLFGKWLFITLLGSVQIAVMFAWGAAWFGLDLAGRLPGFFVMTPVTAAAAASFGLVLATACRSRRQLGGVSTAVILTMSAVGGSMFPRFLMSETMQTIGLLTFNAWALDGYVKVFWRDAPLTALAPQVGVLLGLALVFFGAARKLARRWETV